MAYNQSTQFIQNDQNMSSHQSYTSIEPQTHWQHPYQTQAQSGFSSGLNAGMNAACMPETPIQFQTYMQPLCTSQAQYAMNWMTNNGSQQPLLSQQQLQQRQLEQQKRYQFQQEQYQRQQQLPHVQQPQEQQYASRPMYTPQAAQQNKASHNPYVQQNQHARTAQPGMLAGQVLHPSNHYQQPVQSYQQFQWHEARVQQQTLYDYTQFLQNQQQRVQFPQYQLLRAQANSPLPPIVPQPAYQTIQPGYITPHLAHPTVEASAPAPVAVTINNTQQEIIVIEDDDENESELNNNSNDNNSPTPPEEEIPTPPAPIIPRPPRKPKEELGWYRSKAPAALESALDDRRLPENIRSRFSRERAAEELNKQRANDSAFKRLRYFKLDLPVKEKEKKKIGQPPKEAKSKPEKKENKEKKKSTLKSASPVPVPALGPASPASKAPSVQGKKRKASIVEDDTPPAKREKNSPAIDVQVRQAPPAIAAPLVQESAVAETPLEDLFNDEEGDFDMTGFIVEDEPVVERLEIVDDPMEDLKDWMLDNLDEREVSDDEDDNDNDNDDDEEEGIEGDAIDNGLNEESYDLPEGHMETTVTLPYDDDESEVSEEE